MSLLSLIDLNHDQLESVMGVVTCWCQDHAVSVDSVEGREAIAAAVECAVRGEQSPVALSEAINAALTARSMPTIAAPNDSHEPADCRSQTIDPHFDNTRPEPIGARNRALPHSPRP